LGHGAAGHVSFKRPIEKEAGMLRRAETIRGYELRASDGKIGKVADLYFDDQTWTVRHVVAQTGNWLQDKRVLLSPRKITGLEPDQKVVEASVALAEVEVCEAVDCEKPISERADLLFFPHHFWPPAFEASDMLEAGDVHLRSMEEVKGYRVAATDGEIGLVVGFIIDDADWVIRYFEVDTTILWQGGHVLMSPEWVESVEWHLGRVRVNLPREAIKNSPEFDPNAAVSREYEVDLCRFYNREGYWDRECED
jgi:hypothetical protein